jgi:hypothetical protein
VFGRQLRPRIFSLTNGPLTLGFGCTRSIYQL